ncbi:32846_t:CDS:2 [Gigaspora margarita]|uniref:32846_t:CDS:1 n=1 Tax=Gigaspora margarita TaxID=4874 RepID=A0ABM8W1S5_GIGMA|nr:32846_t:CDS:2 [Gigaspora margarita]
MGGEPDLMEEVYGPKRNLEEKGRNVEQNRRYYTQELAAKEIGLYNNSWADIESLAIYLTTTEEPLNQTEEASNELLMSILGNLSRRKDG